MKDKTHRVSSGSSERSSVHVWETWYHRSHFLFYGVLAVSTALFFLDGPHSLERWAVALGLTLLLGVWHWVTLVRNPHWAQERPLPVLAYFAVTLPLFTGLAYLHPGYQLLNFFLYWYNFSLFRLRWSLPGAAALTLILMWINGGANTIWPLNPALAGGLIITLIVSGVLSLYIGSLIDQSAARHRLIEELETTREDLAAEERRAGVLEERSRLAREIHDTLAQGFISIVTHLEAAEESLSSNEEPGRNHLDQARRTARDNLVEARRLVAALRPELLEGSSLPKALQRSASRWSEQTGVSAEVTITGDHDLLPQELQVTLLRIAQEALSNVGKHAGAREVTLTLTRLEDLILLDVQDDGTGFDQTLIPNGSEGGFGLKSMRERVGQFGGELLVESEPGKGTTLAVQLPLNPADERVSVSGTRP